MIRAEPFNTVFDGTRNFVPRAIIKAIMRPDIIRELQGAMVRGEDGLDEFVAFPARLVMDDGQSVPFALWRHKGNPESTIAVYLPLEEFRFDELLLMILHELGVPESALIWRDTAMSYGIVARPPPALSPNADQDDAELLQLGM